jgi:FtsP/CotA-like multicopper oxidase with cupredoxin domain
MTQHLSKLSRRRFLQLVGGTGLAVTGGMIFTQTSLFQQSGYMPVRAATLDFVPDVEIRLRAIESQQAILSGSETGVWRYTGELIKGEETTLQDIPNSYLGPTIRVRTGQKVRIRFQNELAEASNVHWHGLYVPDYADGHPRFVARSGEEYVYEFEVINHAGTYWYHPHPHERTGAQVYAGMAGLFIVEDDIEDALALPTGDYDLALVIQDRQFDDNNQLQYVTSGHDQTMGFWGETILINGQANAQWSVANRPYRLRLLNGSNARPYILSWSDETPMHVIGTDGGLLEQSVQKPYITLGPAERAELWVDFSAYDVGTELILFDLATSQPGIVGRFVIDQKSDVRQDTPTALRPFNAIDPQQAINVDNPRQFEFAMGMMSPTINGRTFEMNAVAQDEIVRLGDVEIWEFTNNARSGGMMSLPHPVHMHGRQFQVLERRVHPNYAQQLAGIQAGYLDYGWKDTVLLMPGETVRIITKFDDYEGLFVYHCHTLEHEDMGMMRNYEVRA